MRRADLCVLNATSFSLTYNVCSLNLVPCNSAPFLVIRYQLKIDHNTTNVPTEWYKDQGGMHKHMALYVKLTDTEGKIVKPRHGIIHLILRFVPITA